jgi:hypothetical protein
MSQNLKIIVNTYGSDDPPAAATFDVGARTTAEIEQAIDRPREQAERIGPDDLAKRHR